MMKDHFFIHYNYRIVFNIRYDLLRIRICTRFWQHKCKRLKIK